MHLIRLNILDLLSERFSSLLTRLVNVVKLVAKVWYEDSLFKPLSNGDLILKF